MLMDSSGAPQEVSLSGLLQYMVVSICEYMCAIYTNTYANKHVSRVANSATHVVTSTGLSGGKSQRFLDVGSKKKANLHVVRPEWLLDSINAGKPLKEYKYRIVKSEVQDEIHLAH